MAEFVRVFAIGDIGQFHRGIDRLLIAADTLNADDRRAGRRPRNTASRAAILRIYADFSRELDAAAHTAAVAATKAIIAKIEETRLRPETDKKRHLRDMVVSRPANIGMRRGIATGAVGIADIARLNQAIDPDYPGRGSYWEAQEYGTTAHVGRVITGFFHGGALPAGKPSAQLSGGGAVHGKDSLNSAFSPRSKFSPSGGAGSRGGKPGAGTIQVPLKARHFIRDGANEARDVWKSQVFAAQDVAIARLSRVGLGPR